MQTQYYYFLVCFQATIISGIVLILNYYNFITLVNDFYNILLGICASFFVSMMLAIFGFISERATYIVRLYMYIGKYLDEMIMSLDICIKTLEGNTDFKNKRDVVISGLINNNNEKTILDNMTVDYARNVFSFCGKEILSKIEKVTENIIVEQACFKASILKIILEKEDNGIYGAKFLKILKQYRDELRSLKEHYDCIVKENRVLSKKLKKHDI